MVAHRQNRRDFPASVLIPSPLAPSPAPSPGPSSTIDECLAAYFHRLAHRSLTIGRTVYAAVYVKCGHHYILTHPAGHKHADEAVSVIAGWSFDPRLNFGESDGLFLREVVRGNYAGDGGNGGTGRGGTGKGGTGKGGHVKVARVRRNKGGSGESNDREGQ